MWCGTPDCGRAVEEAGARLLGLGSVTTVSDMRSATCLVLMDSAVDKVDKSLLHARLCGQSDLMLKHVQSQGREGRKIEFQQVQGQSPLHLLLSDDFRRKHG